ncbi:hypothetical protein Riv7116_0435 [Rivularia sp. PCC 7116]|uniref:hypothetical protein n=1 Tax=Rivularia sp. PCC 7116 TaxID=373994 RepID=UPI00029F10C7|nr:hypothetical protein [Rivularia sp. PCC 7116]AFY53038.1 hypothetical protein Riv7116_0435 [Rivularia sp. PCC 7116]
MLNSIDKIGDWNPQLLRELKGRLKPFPVIIAIVTSLATQLIIFLYQLRDFPGENYRTYSKYCKARDLGKLNPELRYCPTNQIDMQLWWRDHWEYIFLALSVILIFTLLVAGTYLIVNDLSQEERRGTLNFIRLSPQSETSIFTGKLIGVPVLIYLVSLAAIPFHIFSGKLANISFSHILCFYLILIASCICFYSVALLIGIFGGSVLSGFKPWLASGLLMLFLMITVGMNQSSYYEANIAFFRLFSPLDMTNFLFPNLFYKKSVALEELRFFSLPLGRSIVTLVAIHLLNYAVWTYWAWQGLKRCFRNPNATIFSKQQSYLIVTNFEIIILGFLLSENFSSKHNFFNSLESLYIWNLFLFIGLFAIILPPRQAVQDWARFRYHRVSVNSNSSKNSLVSDLLVSEKSPAILAIGITLLIAASAFMVMILNLETHFYGINYQVLGCLGVLLFISSTIIYATIAQIMLMLKNSKRHLWALGATGASIILPAFILLILSVPASSTDNIGSLLWLFTTGFWYGVENSRISSVFTVFVCQSTIAALLNWYLIKQVKSAGESATKALFANSEQ